MTNPTDWMDPDKTRQNLFHKLTGDNGRAVIISLENLQMKDTLLI